MQEVGDALQGGSTIPRRRRLSGLVAIVVIATMMVALLVWAAPFASNEFGTEEANPVSAGVGSSAVFHDDPWNLPSGNAGSPAVIHDDADKVHPD